MAWHPLGTINLSNEWQLLNQPVVGGESFRIRQLWFTPTKPYGKVLIAQFYNQPQEIYGIRVFYPTTDLKIIEMAVPKDFQDAGIITRYLGLKLVIRHTSLSSEWQVSVDQFV